IVRSMPGAGGLTMINYLYSQAPKDGTAIASGTSNMAVQSLTGVPNADYDMRKFGWLGSPEVSETPCAAMTKSGVLSFQDALTKEATMGAPGPANPGSFMVKIVNGLLGTKFKVIEGYKDTGEILLAMERGELDGTCTGAEIFPRNPFLV